MVISSLVYICLWVFTCFREKWLWVGIIPLVYIITDVICMGVLISLKIDEYSKSIEERIDQNRERNGIAS